MNFLFNHTPLLYFTQSFWRDEAYSTLFSAQSIPFILKNSALEPPLYYLMLHFWIKLVGQSEIAVRSFSLLGFVLSCIVMIHLSERLFKRHFLSWFLPIFYFFNPMLLYYAFEARAYSWYICFTTLSIYLYHEKRWKWFTLATLAGIYTHLYFLIIPFIQTLHYLIINKRLKLTDKFAKSLIIIGVCSLPALLRIFIERSNFGYAWYFPVDFHLIKSVLGNMFIGYEGTPWFIWPYTALLSIILICFFVLAWKNKKLKNDVLLFTLLVFIPLISVVGVSFIKPLFVNRYVIPVTIGEILLLACALHAIPNKRIAYSLAGIMLTGVLLFNLWYPPLHKKVDIRTTIHEINTVMLPTDVITVSDSLVYFESVYYALNRSRVYLYNPTGSPFPWFVGRPLFSQNRMLYEFPPYPTRAFLVSPDASFSVHYTVPIKGQMK